MEAFFCEDLTELPRQLGVAVSGGSDSLSLLDALAATIPQVQLRPIFVYQHPSQSPNILGSYIAHRHGLELHVHEQPVPRAAEVLRKQGVAPCRVCAPDRRLALGNVAADLGLDAIALGHHLTDLAATLLMNMFHRGTLSTMKPVVRDRYGVLVLRPLYRLPEKVVKRASPVPHGGLFSCGYCDETSTSRRHASQFVNDMLSQHAPATQFITKAISELARAD